MCCCVCVCVCVKNILLNTLRRQRSKCFGQGVSLNGAISIDVFKGTTASWWGITPTVKLYRSHHICISNLFFTWFYYFWKICIYCKKLCDWTSNTSLIMFTSNSYHLVFLNTKISKDNFLSTILKQMFKYVSKFKVIGFCG